MDLGRESENYEAATLPATLALPFAGGSCRWWQLSLVAVVAGGSCGHLSNPVHSPMVDWFQSPSIDEFAVVDQGGHGGII